MDCKDQVRKLGLQIPGKNAWTAKAWGRTRGLQRPGEERMDRKDLAKNTWTAKTWGRTLEIREEPRNCKTSGRTHVLRRPWKNVDCKDPRRTHGLQRPGGTHALERPKKNAWTEHTREKRFDCSKDLGRTLGLQRPVKNAWTAKTREEHMHCKDSGRTH